MMGPAFPEQTASAWPYALSRRGATRIGRRTGRSPLTLPLAVCLAVAVVLTAVSAAIMLVVIPSSAAVPGIPSAGPTVLETPRPARPTLTTTYEGPASCAEPGFLTGDTIGEANPAGVYRALCEPASPKP